MKTKNFNIAFNSSSIRKGNLTGIGYYAYYLSRELEKIKEIEMLYFNERMWDKKLIINEKSKYSTIKSFVRDNVPYAYDVYRLLVQKRFEKVAHKNLDLYHEPNFMIYPTSLPSIATIHDCSWIEHPELHPATRVKAMNKYMKFTLENADHIIVDAKFTKKMITKLSGYPPKKIDVIPLGVDDLFMPYSRAYTKDFLDSLGLKFKSYFLLVGTLEPRKNLVSALKAYISLPLKIKKNFKLVIVGGKGWLNDEFDSLSNSIINNGDLLITGYLSLKGIREIYAGAKIFIFPSKYEGFGLPVLEAMKSGVPVISSNSSSLPEVCNDAALQFDPLDIDGIASCIKKIVNDPFLEKKLISLGHENTKKFSWQKTAIKTVETYHKVLNIK